MRKIINIILGIVIAFFLISGILGFASWMPISPFAVQGELGVWGGILILGLLLIYVNLRISVREKELMSQANSRKGGEEL